MKYLGDSCSICMATFNGEKFLKEQLNSILEQLSDSDEIVIVDDCSTDSTISIISGMNDKRIRLYRNSNNMGHVYSFGKSISLSTKEYVFLSDQDDIWVYGRRAQMIHDIVSSDALLVTTNFELFFGNERKGSKSNLKNIDSNHFKRNILGIFLGRRAYFGCTMAFKSELKKIILPIPRIVESHDHWIALASNLLKRNVHDEKTSLIRRIHENNVTKQNRSFYNKIKTRYVLFISLIILLYRIAFIKNRIT